MKEYLLTQIIQTNSYIMHWHVLIVSGLYKNRKLSQAVPLSEQYPDGWRPFTDEEKLKDAFDTMQQHQENLSALVNKFQREL